MDDRALLNAPTGPLLAALLVSALAAGCAGRRGAAAPPDDLPPRPDASGWVSTRHRDHPLVGKIWSPRSGTFVDDAELQRVAAGAHLLLLGETHDNPDHHLLQARLVRAVSAGGRRPALAFEMLDVGKQAAVDEALARAPRDPGALAEAVGWATSGWPPFAIYRPVFEAGLDAGLPIAAANLSRAQARELAAKGPETLEPAVRARLERVGPFPEDVVLALRQEMSDSHCGEFPEARVEPMLTAQKARDAQMAERLAAADRGQGAILIAGRGHVRTDVGVPVFLDAGPDRPVVSIAITEVHPEATRPEEYRSEYGSGPLPFDLVVFTPAMPREDPCARLRAAGHSKPPASPAPAAP
jgi:uncharacterized iron-regulated protein